MRSLSKQKSLGLRLAAVIAILIVGGVHLQQYFSFGIRSIPTVGVLFLLNAIGAATVAILLLTPWRLTQVLGALGGLGISIGAIVSLMIARTPPGFFNYIEPTWRTPVVIALVAEAVSVLLLTGFLVMVGIGQRARARARPALR
jgi:hypothetical protein